jgi:Flp pilus assembly protein TadD
LTVLLEQVDALSGRGDTDAARNVAELAVHFAESPNVSPAQRAQALNTLAVLLMLRGDYDSSEAPLSRAVSSSSKSDTAYRQSANNLGVLAELRGDRHQAETRYAEALRALSDDSGAPPQERQAVETNLARVRGSR